MSLYNLLFSENFIPEKLENELFLVIDQILDAVGANCGTIALAPINEKYYVECATSGYGEEGFFYEFLSRDLKHLKNVEESSLPLVFYSKDYKLYFDYSDFALVCRIPVKDSRPVGFVLFEFTGMYQDIMSLFLGMFAIRIGQIYSQKYDLCLKDNLVDFGNGEVKIDLMDLLAPLSRGFQGIKNLLKNPDVLLISGKKGTGKKSFAKYIYQTFRYKGDCIFINSIPEQFGKLERALAEWTIMVGNGVVVFDDVRSFSIGQQDLFYQFLKNKKGDFSLFFIDSENDGINFYQPFWDMLNEHIVVLPELNYLDKEELQVIIKKMFYDLKMLHGRSGLKISASTIDLLTKYNYSENLRELRGILENSILRSKDSLIEIDDLNIGSKSDLKSMVLANEDLNLRKCVENLERQKIILANKLFAGNQMRMAKALGISRGSLQYKMKQFELGL